MQFQTISERVQSRPKSWSNGILVGFDTETTGIDPESARIVSAAIVVDNPGYEPVIFDWLVNPGIDIALQATAIHGISTEHAQAHGMMPARAIREMLGILRALQRFPLVLVNSPFDLTIVSREIKRHGIGSGLELPQNVVDTLTCDRMLDPYRRGRRTLTATSAAYGITIKGAHTAAGDVICSIRLARAMAEKYPKFASADLGRYQARQREACQRWAEQFTEYRRTDDPDFWCDGSWPWRMPLSDASDNVTRIIADGSPDNGT